MPDVKCHVCGYSWFTKSEMAYVTCPNCGRKTQVRGFQKVEEKKRE